MPIHKEERLLSYNAEQIFDLVIAVDRYPEFLPWCLSANIIKEVDQTFDADLVIGFKMFRQRFISRVTSRRPDWIEVIPISGPFKRMNNSWRFKTQSEDTCMIDFYVDFEYVFRRFCVRILQKAENIGAEANPRLQLLAPGPVHPGAQLHQFSCPNSIGEMICVFVKVYTFGFPWNNITYRRNKKINKE